MLFMFNGGRDESDECLVLVGVKSELIVLDVDRIVRVVFWAFLVKGHLCFNLVKIGTIW